MRFFSFSIALLASASSIVLANDGGLTIDVTKKVECERKTKSGDNIGVHYKGTLVDGTVFDSSYNRNQPFSFGLGKGQVIKGWDQGLLDMCIGEKRTLTIPPSLGYGNRGTGAIPAGSTLIFETELISIQGVEQPKPVSSASASVSSAATEASEGIKAKVASKVAEAAEAIKVTVQDTDDSGQEHNEL